MKRNRITVYTDGSCLKNPNGPGGYAAVLIDDDGKETIFSGGEPSTTNNRMEMCAVLAALKNIHKKGVHNHIIIYTDSKYIQHAFVRGWIGNWMENGWITSVGTPVKNKDLWMEILSYISTNLVEFRWVKGHCGNKYNELCDEIARNEADKYKVK